MVSSKKVIVGIFTCKKYLDTRYKFVKRKWFDFLDKDLFDCYYIIGDNDIDKPYITGDKIILKCDDTYEQLINKTYNFIKFCKNNFEFDYIFKCDDDTYINVDEFKKIRVDLIQNIDYAGVFTLTPSIESVSNDFLKSWKTLHWKKCEDENFKIEKNIHFNLRYAYGGTGYFLSNKAIKYILQYSEDDWYNTPETYIGEDVKVGIALSKHVDLKYINLKDDSSTDDIDIMLNGSTMHPYI
jgi:hypothetical protein